MAVKSPQGTTYYSISEAAELLGMSRSALYRLVQDNRVPYRLMPNGLMRMTVDDLKAIEADAFRPPIAAKSRRAA